MICRSLLDVPNVGAKKERDDSLFERTDWLSALEPTIVTTHKESRIIHWHFYTGIALAYSTYRRLIMNDSNATHHADTRLPRNYRTVVTVAALVFSTLVLPGCQLIANIFATGVWLGVILVVGVVALIFWLIFAALT